MSRFLNVLFVLIALFPALAQASGYTPGGDPANWDIPSEISEECLGAIVLPAGTPVSTDSGSHKGTLVPVGSIVNPQIVIIDVCTAERIGSVWSGFFTKCHNKTTFPARPYSPTTLTEVPQVDLDLYAARAMRDVSETWFHTVIAAADFCAGGNLRIYPGHHEPEWTPAPLPDHVRVTQQARSSSALVQALGETRALSPGEAAAPANTATYNRERWEKLTRCPEADKANWVVDWLTGECRAPESLSESFVAITGEKLAEFDNKEQYDKLEAYLLRAGVMMRGSVNDGTYREYIFPDVCAAPPHVPTIAETYAAGQADFQAWFKPARGFVRGLAGGGKRFGQEVPCATCDRDTAVGSVVFDVGGTFGNHLAAAEVFGRFGTGFTARADMPGTFRFGGGAGFVFGQGLPAGFRATFVVEADVEPVAWTMRTVAPGGELAGRVNLYGVRQHARGLLFLEFGAGYYATTSRAASSTPGVLIGHSDGQLRGFAGLGATF